MIIAFIGHSGSGKSTLMNYLVNHLSFNLAEWYTTRAPRAGRDDDYHFLEPAEFLKLSETMDFEEVGINYGNLYATTYEHPKRVNYVTVTDPVGAAASKLKHGDNYVGIYVEASEADRTARMFSRGDSIKKVTERIAIDREKFKNAFHVSDYKISSLTQREDVDELIDIIKDIEKEKGVRLFASKHN